MKNILFLFALCIFFTGCISSSSRKSVNKTKPRNKFRPVITETKESTIKKKPVAAKTSKTVKGPHTAEIKHEEPTKTVIVKKRPKKQDPMLITVNETDLVHLVPTASDPDNDKLLFMYTNPLDKDGKWQTTYGSAGKYPITITVSDGKFQSSMDVLLVVKKKEAPTVINSYAPKEKICVIDELDELVFSVTASDLNEPKLAYSWTLDGNKVSNDRVYKYKTNYFDAGLHTVKIEVTDGFSKATKAWSVKVNNVNRPPVLKPLQDIEVNENELITISPKATDADGDKLVFTMSKPVGDDGSWRPSYADSGEYVITVTASDGTDTVKTSLKVTVKDVNRKPMINSVENKVD